MTAPLVQRVQPRKTAAGWRVYVSGWNLDLVDVLRVSDLPGVLPDLQTSRDLEFVLPSDLGEGVHPLQLEGAFGALPLRALTVAPLDGLDLYAPARRDTSDYTQHLLELLPKGPAWSRRLGSNFGKLFSAAAEEIARVHALAEQILREWSPTHTTSLAEWEAELGLPERCDAVVPTTDEHRRAAIVRKSNSLGGSSAVYFEHMAALYGYTIAVSEVYPSAAPFKAGLSVAGDALFQGPWLFAWRVSMAIPETSVEVFTAGAGRAGEPLRRWGVDGLECMLRSLKPSHTLVVFSYTFGGEDAQIGNDGDVMIGNTGETMVGG